MNAEDALATIGEESRSKGKERKVLRKTEEVARGKEMIVKLASMEISEETTKFYKR